MRPDTDHELFHYGKIVAFQRSFSFRIKKRHKMNLKLFIIAGLGLICTRSRAHGLADGPVSKIPALFQEFVQSMAAGGPSKPILSTNMEGLANALPQKVFDAFFNHIRQTEKMMVNPIKVDGYNILTPKSFYDRHLLGLSGTGKEQIILPFEELDYAVHGTSLRGDEYEYILQTKKPAIVFDKIKGRQRLVYVQVTGFQNKASTIEIDKILRFDSVFYPASDRFTIKAPSLINSIQVSEDIFIENILGNTKSLESVGAVHTPQFIFRQTTGTTSHPTPIVTLVKVEKDLFPVPFRSIRMTSFLSNEPVALKVVHKDEEGKLITRNIQAIVGFGGFESSSGVLRIKAMVVDPGNDVSRWLF